MATVKYTFDARLKKTKSASPVLTKGIIIEIDSKDANKVIQDIRKIIAEKLNSEYPGITSSDIQNLRKL